MKNKLIELRLKLQDLYFEIDYFLNKQYDLGYVEYFLEKIKDRIWEMENNTHEK